MTASASSAAPSAAAAPTFAFGEDSRRRLEHVAGALAAVAVSAILAVARKLSWHVQVSLAVNLGLSVLAFLITTSSIHGMGPSFIAARLRGIDLNKPTTKRDAAGNLVRPIEGVEIPESMGTIAATVFILTMAVFIPFAFAAYERSAFPHAVLAEYLSAILTITFATFMGFADDVLDLRWRHKIPLPFLATLPLLLVYYANGNETGMMVPNPLRGLLGDQLDLGILFYGFLLILAVFSTHTINIYAGVNGLEAGQSVVIALSVLVLNVVQLYRIPEHYAEYRHQQVQSLFLMVPFLSVSFALLRLNWWPAKVFVGDTYCYFAGMTFAAVCILSRFTKTMVVLMLPQWINFLYSCPQLFKPLGIPNPRHRMPAYDAKSGLVMNSYTEVKPAEHNAIGKVVFWVIKTFRLAHVKPPREDGTVLVSNLTLINFVLYVFGPCREDVLCIRLLLLQLLCTIGCFAVRFGLAGYVFDVVL